MFLGNSVPVDCLSTGKCAYKGHHLMLSFLAIWSSLDTQLYAYAASIQQVDGESNIGKDNNWKFWPKAMALL